MSSTCPDTAARRLVLRTCPAGLRCGTAAYANLCWHARICAPAQTVRWQQRCCCQYVGMDATPAHLPACALRTHEDIGHNLENLSSPLSPAGLCFHGLWQLLLACWDGLPPLRTCPPVPCACENIARRIPHTLSLSPLLAPAFKACGPLPLLPPYPSCQPGV